MSDEETNKPEEAAEAAAPEAAAPEAAPEAAKAPEAAPEAAAEAPAAEAPKADAPAAEAPAAEAPKADAPAPEAPKADAPPAEGALAPQAIAKAEAEKAEEQKTKDVFAEIMGEGEQEKVKIHKAKTNKNVIKGLVHITATFNNTVVTVTDMNGNSIGWSTAGKMGFRGSRKSTAYAAQVVSQDACRQAMSHGLKEVDIRVKGPGAGREAAVRAVQGLGIELTTNHDVTPVPQNGCRPKKARRV
jgi:small subunit ribosomal protein S11